MSLQPGQLRRLFAALSSEIQKHFGITAAARVLRAAGFSSTGVQHWQPLMRSVEIQFEQFSFEDQVSTVRILAERLLEQTYPADIQDSVKSLLADHGFQFVGGRFVPISLFDERELRFLPEAAAGEISTALNRLSDGDLDGAISAACGTVETTISSLMEVSAGDTFQQKARAGIDAAGRLAALPDQLIGMGWKRERAQMLCQNLRGTLNQAAMVMQMLRSDMGDVHGAKQVLEPVVYDALKLASVLVSLMKPI